MTSAGKVGSSTSSSHSLPVEVFTTTSRMTPSERLSRWSTSRGHSSPVDCSPSNSPRESPDSCHHHCRESRSWPCSRSSSVSSSFRPISSAHSTGSLVKGKSSTSKKKEAYGSKSHNTRHSPYPPGAVKRNRTGDKSNHTTPSTSPKLLSGHTPLDHSSPRQMKEGLKAEASLPSPPGTSSNTQDVNPITRYPFEYSSFMDVPPSALGWFVCTYVCVCLLYADTLCMLLVCWHLVYVLLVC